MAVKIRCSECRKKISVDEAFAGSMCRCPYCKSIVRVPGHVGSPLQRGGRPSRPGRPGRPGAPTARARQGEQGTGLENVVGSRPIISGDQTDSSPGPAGPRITEPGGTQMMDVEEETDQEAQARQRGGVIESIHVDESKLSPAQLSKIPTANPVFFQGIVTLILIVVLVIMTAASIYLGIQVFGPTDETAYVEGYEAPTALVELPNPFVVVEETPTVAGGTTILPPVFYCVDAGASMGDVFLWARDVVRASVLSLESTQTFGVVTAQDDGPKLLAGKTLAGGVNGEKTLRPILAARVDGGQVRVGGRSELLPAVELALKQKPRTVVLIVSRKAPSRPTAIGELCKAATARLVVVLLGADNAGEIAGCRQAVKAAGKGSTLIAYDDLGTLQDYYDQSDLPQ